MCGVGTDIHLDHEDLDAAFAPGRNFANKLWNAGRFTLMSVGEDAVLPLAAVEGQLEAADRWILSRLSRTTREMTDGLERFRLHDAVERGHHFFWRDFADWYLELAKGRLRGEEGEESRAVARAVLVHVFDGVLRLLHPLVPFVTEFLWDRIPWPEGAERPESLLVAPWPSPRAELEHPEAEAYMDHFQEMITAIRSLRKEYGVGEGARVSLVLTGVAPAWRGAIESEKVRLDQLARVGQLDFAEVPPRGAGATAVLRDGTELFLRLDGLVDLDRERSRLREEIRRLEGQLSGTEAKLSNENFVSRAPEAVVEKEREKASTYRDQRDKLRVKLTTLELK
jgi:valyl-tRNA synthetase